MKFYSMVVLYFLFNNILPCSLFGQTHADEYAYRSFTFDNKTIPYRLFYPEIESDKQYPLITVLHGINDRGYDNEKQILGNRLAFAWSDSANQAQWPCFVIAPQCPVNIRWYPYDFQSREFAVWDMVVHLIDSLAVELPIDTSRLYLTGISLGGYGTWHFISEYPDKFAAAVPVAGGGDTTQVTRYKHLPLWNFHGENDKIVPVERSREMVKALQNQGKACLYTHCHAGDCDGLSESEIEEAIHSGATFIYTEWQDGPHEIWDQSYDYPYLFPWVFSQSKDSQFTGVWQPGTLNADKFNLLQNYPNPFNPETTIKYQLNQPGHVIITIYNLSGQRVTVLVNTFQLPGDYGVTWQPKALPSGLYFYNLTVDGYSKTKKLLFAR